MLFFSAKEAGEGIVQGAQLFSAGSGLVDDF
jgi:hypothetical protein